jgi:hypothetical protein
MEKIQIRISELDDCVAPDQSIDERIKSFIYDKWNIGELLKTQNFVICEIFDDTQNKNKIYEIVFDKGFVNGIVICVIEKMKYYCDYCSVERWSIGGGSYFEPCIKVDNHWLPYPEKLLGSYTNKEDFYHEFICYINEGKK